MASNLTRISAPAGSGKTRYVTNRVITALFRDEPVLLISLDPQQDPYAEEMDRLRAQAFYHDCEIIPDQPGALGSGLTYVCWAAEGEADGYPHLLGHLRVEPASLLRPSSWGRKTLVILDGCQWLSRRPLAPWAAQIREFVAGCVAGGHPVVTVGEHDADTAWLAQQAGAAGAPRSPASLCQPSTV